MDNETIEVKPPQNTTKKGIWIGLGVAAVIGLLGFGGYRVGVYLGQQKEKSSVSTASPTTGSNNATTTSTLPATENNSATTSPAVATTTSTVTRVTDAGVTWVEPQKLADIKLFEKLYDASISEASVNQYYKVADLNDGGAIIYNTNTIVGDFGPDVLRFRKDGQGKYFYLVNHSPGVDSISNIVLSPGVKIDSSTRYQSLSNPDLLKFNNIILRKSFGSAKLFSELKERESQPASDIALEKIGLTEYGEIYNDEALESELHSRFFVIKLADSSLAYYLVDKDFLADDGSLIATLNAAGGSFKVKKFDRGLTGGSGCGSQEDSDQLYISADIASRLTLIGKTKSGKNLYAPKSDADPIYKIAYETYKIGREDKALSLADFAAKKPIILWQDGFGEYLPFMDKEYAAMAECGKPVIYLYPQSKTQVSVKVDADIKKSDPTYNNGWDVTADPTGKLINADGKAYDSLFWEGKGFGVYPAVTQGRIVESRNIERELRADLNQLGLNQKESQDFLDFWLPKMPKNPYIRLTWFGTAQMNQLAPLAITPKPDTMIRVFLDFGGQNSSLTDLKPQVLRLTERRGFTVLEWGGLLIGE